MSLFKNALTLLVGNTDDLSYLKMPKSKHRTRTLSERELIQRESEIGRELFGPIPKGHTREFFCLDELTCIWYESYKDKSGKEITATTRYEIQGDKVLKAQEGARYSYLEGQELDNLLRAISIYYERVMRGVYSRDPDTGTIRA
ncbi:hypothetical protein H7142_02150 [Candidatus Saccharibacteria bacterium]|nr:hypothetical protein [Candidatus Saccharibacteria bacterium]